MRQTLHFLFLCGLLLGFSASLQAQSRDLTEQHFRDDIPGKDSCMTIPYFAPGIDPYAFFDLHPGLNVSLSFSATVGLSSAPKGIGFGNAIDLYYIKPLSERVTLSGGIDMDNFTWGAYQYHNLNASAMLSYRLTEKASVSAYVRKVIGHTSYPTLLRPYGNTDCIGARLDVQVNPSFSFGVSVEKRSFPSN